LLDFGKGGEEVCIYDECEAGFTRSVTRVLMIDSFHSQMSVSFTVTILTHRTHARMTASSAIRRAEP